MKNNKIEEQKKLSGKDGFEKFYEKIFSDRWENLKKSLLDESVYAEISHDGCEKYFLDPASVFASSLLPVENAEKILDLCAAPGGKTLVLSSRMNENSVLFSNERSFQRKQRLFQVCKSSLPEKIFNKVKISCSDGKKWCLSQKECFDSILLDAPCSSERHVLKDSKYLNSWSPSRIKSLAMEQWALISSAYRLVKPSGFLLYSTCALSFQENDGIIERLLKKFPDSSLVYEKSEPSFSDEIQKFCKMPFIPVFERTPFGFHILPDKNKGSGPIWFSLIQKKN